jgi:hypothetical protein
MKKEVLNYYLYVSWDKKREDQDDNLKFSSYMMVAKTMAKEELGSEVQALSDGVFVFSSNKDFETIKNKLRHRQFPYMLIDITFNMSNGLISTFLQDCEIDILNKFVDKSKKNELEYFNLKMHESVYNEQYETAAIYRDLIKNKIVSNNQDIK